MKLKFAIKDRVTIKRIKNNEEKINNDSLENKLIKKEEK